jgi:hypothetical protein
MNYGLKIIRSDWQCRIVVEPTTWRHRWYAFQRHAYDAFLIFMISLAFTVLVTVLKH